MTRLATWLIPLLFLACSGPLESTHRQADLFGRVAIKLYVLDEERGPIAAAARELEATLNGPESLVERRSRFATPIPEDAVVLGTRGAFEASGAAFAPPEAAAEAFRIQISEVAGRKSIYVVGADPAGVLYGSLELCEQIFTRGNVPVLQRAKDVARAPQLRRRGVALTVQAPAAPGDWWFRDEELWRRFLDDVGRSRFNRLDLHGPWLLPWLVVPPGYEHRTVPRSEADLNLRALARIVELAGDRGIDVGLVSLGTAPWLPQHGTSPGPEDVAMAPPYLERALPILCARVPRLKAIGFAGGPGDSPESVLAALRQVLNRCGARVECMVTAGAVPAPAVGELAREGPGRVCLGESFGGLPLPYPSDLVASAARLSGRDGARMHWDVTVGSWLPSADPQFVRRVIPTLELLESQGLALHLGDASITQDALLHSAPTLMVWGRHAFDAMPDVEALTAGFRERFGSEAGPHVMEGMALASRMVARSVSMRSEHVNGDDLNAWTWFTPGDPRWQMDAQEFAVRAAWAAPARAADAGIAEASFPVAGRVARAASGRRTPIQAADELLALADRALAEFTKAQPLVRTRAAEFAAHAADAALVARSARGMAPYAKAGTFLALYRQTLDPAWLDQCATELRAAELPDTPFREQDLQHVASQRARHTELFGEAPPVRRVTLPAGEGRADFRRPVVEIQVGTGKGNTRTVDASARASKLPDDMEVFLCVEPGGSTRDAVRLPMRPRGDSFTAQGVLGNTGGTVQLEFVRRDGSAMLHPDPDAGMPFVLVPPRRGAELLPEPGTTERLDSLSAEDLARFSCVLVGSQALLDQGGWTSLQRMATGGMTVVVFAQEEPHSDVLPQLPGGLTRSGTTERILWRAPEALAALVEGLPEAWAPGRQQSALAAGDDQWTRVGEPAVIAVRPHGQGRLVVVQADILTILGQPVAERVLRNVLKFAGALAGDKAALVVHPGNGGLPLGLTLAGVPFQLLSQLR